MAEPMSKTRLYVECPNCHMQYLMKDFGLTYSNGASIENVAGSPELQRLICPCQLGTPYKFKLKERTRLHVFQENESEKTHFSLRPVRRGSHEIHGAAGTEGANRGPNADSGAR
jgi:hypothetical protein